MTSSGAVVGDVAGSTGIVNVSDAVAQWNNSGFLTVAASGTGTLTITAGVAMIGENKKSIGTVKIQDGNSQWVNTRLLTAGGGGQGTLTVSGGGKVASAAAVIADKAGAKGEVTVARRGLAVEQLRTLDRWQPGDGTLTVQKPASLLLLCAALAMLLRSRHKAARGCG